MPAFHRPAACAALLGAALSHPAGGLAQEPPPAAPPASAAVAPAPPGPPFAQCIAALRRELPSYARVRPDTFDTYTRAAQDLRPTIATSTASQPEFKLAVWDYLARLVDDERIADGRRVLAEQADALAAIARRRGVDAATVVAVFGVETDYGRVRGRYPVVDATLSRSCLVPESGERRRHFFDALWLLQEGYVAPDRFFGSWAGAFGMTQFMPGTFAQYMDDGDGSGKADIIDSVPDALATTARYLEGLGWHGGTPWAVEVQAPAAAAGASALEQEHGCLAASADAGGKCRSVHDWARLGVRRIDGTPLEEGRPALDPSTRAALVMPAGPAGPAWLATPNFQALWRYNRADAYALAIGLLSDALRNGPSMRTPWPTDDPGLSRAQFRELQALLAARGYADVRPDGMNGPRTQAAVRAEEARLGWRESGRGGMKLLASLRAAAPAAEAPASAASAAPAALPASAAGPPPGASPPSAAPAQPAAPAASAPHATR